MSKKREEAREKREETKEKPIFGSGAEPSPEPNDDGLVKCVCTVPCAWRGYHDEGDRVLVDRKMLENDPFFKGHFKAVEAQPGGQRSQDEREADENEPEADESEREADESENAEGELGLK